MSHFHLHPGGQCISFDAAKGNVVPVKGHTIVVGLWGRVDFGGGELDVLSPGDDIMIPERVGFVGDSSLWRIAVKPSVRARKKPVDVTLLDMNQHGRKTR